MAVVFIFNIEIKCVEREREDDDKIEHIVFIDQ